MLQNFHILPPSPYLWPTMSSSISTVSKFHSVKKRLSKTSFWYSQHTNDVSITSLWHPQRTKDIFMFTRHKKQIFPKRVYDSYQFPLKFETIDCIYKKYLFDTLYILTFTVISIQGKLQWLRPFLSIFSVWNTLWYL